MIEIPNISQTTAMGSNNSQIGLQYNHEEHKHYGLSTTDAVEIAFKLFHDHYPQLRAEMLQDVRQMVIQELATSVPQNIIEPSPRIAVNTLQSASNADEVDVRKLYAKLLASAMDNGIAKRVHPSFPKIIDQMNAYDARLLKKVADIKNSIPVARVIFTFENKYLTEIMPHYYSPYFEELSDNWATSFSIENLARLQLINIFEGTVSGYDYDAFKTDPFVCERFEYAKYHNPTRDLSIKVTEFVIQQTDFGKQFIEVCMPDRGD